MVCSRNIIVAVCFNALNCVIGIKSKELKNLLVNCIIKWHEFLLGEQTIWLFILKLFVPGMCPNLLNIVSLVWIDLKNLTYEMSAVGRKELWDFVVTRKNFFI